MGTAVPPAAPSHFVRNTASRSGTAYLSRQAWLISQLTLISGGLFSYLPPGDLPDWDGCPTTEMEAVWPWYKDTQAAFQISLSNRFQLLQELIEDGKTDIKTQGEHCKKLWHDTCEDVLGKKKTQCKEWISADTIHKLETRRERSFSFSFSSRWHRSARKGPYALHPVSQQSPRGCPQNSTNICLVEHRSLSTLEGGMSAASFLHSSFLQAVNAVMFWLVCVEKVPQASEHLCPAKLQTRCDICCACQSICPFIPTDSGVPRTVDPQKSL